MPSWVDEPEDPDGVPAVWRRCLARLEEELTSQQFNTFIRPLQVRLEGTKLVVLAPNDHVKKQVRAEYLPLVWDLFDLDEYADIQELELTVGTRERSAGAPLRVERKNKASGDNREPNLDRSHVFANYVEGKSNEVARAAAQQVATNVGRSYNPLLLYGGVRERAGRQERVPRVPPGLRLAPAPGRARPGARPTLPGPAAVAPMRRFPTSPPPRRSAPSSSTRGMAAPTRVPGGRMGRSRRT
ncbi:MAG: DnaA/Hda family protein [Acidobacteria bacterium]|nr:DnaA/Hda family protein [Acidobacteriota bacterium]